MKNIIAALALALAAPAVSASCYNLDATQAQLDQLNAATVGWQQPQLPVVTNGTSVDFVLSPTAPDTTLHYMAASRDGMEALVSATQTGIAAGDVALPASPHAALIELILDNFPWTPLSRPDERVMLRLSLLNGDTFGLQFPETVNAINIGITAINSTSATEPYPLALRVHGVTITNGKRAVSVVDIPVVPGSTDHPVPHRLGLFLDMETRHVAWVVDNYIRGYLVDSTGQHIVIPEGVTSVVQSVNGFLNMDSTDPLQGAHVGGTLYTGLCKVTPPPVTLLPNGNVYQGGGNAYGLKK